MLLFLIKMECVLDLVTKTLTVRRPAVSTMLLFINVACSATLYYHQLRATCGTLQKTYSCVEFFLSFARCKLRDNVGRATVSVQNLWSETRRFAHVASTPASGGELIGSRFTLRTFACDSTICINGIISTDVSST